MGLLDHERFLHLHGQKIARLNRNQSIHPPSARQRTLLMTLISPFVLYGAEAHLKKLQEISTDFLVNDILWKDMMDQITDEWREFTMFVRFFYYFLSFALPPDLLIMIYIYIYIPLF